MEAQTLVDYYDGRTDGSYGDLKAVTCEISTISKFPEGLDGRIIWVANLPPDMPANIFQRHFSKKGTI
jgi:hypothetical protein